MSLIDCVIYLVLSGIIASNSAFGNQLPAYTMEIQEAARACTTTLTINPSQVAGVVSTLYRATSTEVSQVSCDGCALAVRTQAQGFGPPPQYTATLTAPVTTIIAYACS
ncbi:hypothetical protein BKA67DRAFT_549896 [Truncatella angustata]|uniref:Uncharacterized protein n=1 Tax=Truncatella angustata TaxID=152316 RepID=A0A9P8UZE6_9PEZI|nr:uncharacterized protein BKA67DRAFT_549896 [Truncatella angustata]KAH6661012.1 hypothetical protein BKA67DRAFT_549896 [Truncatella angustata]